MTPLQAIINPRLPSGRRLLAVADRLTNGRRRALVVAHDVVLAATSVLLAVYLRLGTLGTGATTEFLLIGTPIFVAIFITVMILFRMHLGLWRYTSTAELVSIVQVVTISIVAFYFVYFALERGAGVPRSVPVIQWFVLLFALAGTRLAYRMARAETTSSVHRFFGRPVAERTTPVLLVGTNDAASAFIRMVHHNRDRPFHVVGLMGLDGGHTGRLLHNVPVLGALPDLESITALLQHRGLKPARLVVAEELDPESMTSLLDRANALGMTLCRMPAPVDFRDASATDRLQVRPIALEDVLGRPQAVLDQEAIDRLILGRRILVTGAGGSIGAELVRQIARRDPAELTLLDHGEYNLYRIDHEIGSSHPALHRRTLLCDVRSRSRVIEIFERHRPEIVFHAAALKHVPMVELNPCEGVLTNAIGTKNVADAADTHGARAFVQISTDKAVNPTNVMGATKRLAEFYVQALDLQAAAPAAGAAAVRESQSGGARQGNDTETTGAMPRTRFMTVRFGNVLGSSGSVVPLFQEQLSRGGPLTVTHPEIKRYFMTIPEAVSLVLHASAHGLETDHDRGRIFVLDMGEPARIIDIARQMIRLAGLEPEKDIHIEITGLRPGEKLYEELFDVAETRSPALISGVFTASPRPVPLAELSGTLDTLADHCSTGDALAARAVIGRVVPGYACNADLVDGRPNVLQ